MVAPVILLTLLVAISLAACNGETQPDRTVQPAQTREPSTTSTLTTDATAPPTPTPEPTAPPTPTPEPTAPPTPTPEPTAPPTPTPEPTAPPTSTPKPTAPPTPTPEPTAPPTPTPEPTPNVGFGPGTYQVGSDIQPGIYAGMAGTHVRDSCYWARLSGASGEFSDLIANENAIGQFYVEVLNTDAFLEVSCEITSLDLWPAPDTKLSRIDPGMYIVGRDIEPGTYRGEAGTDVRDSCYWARLSGASGEFSDLIANDNARGQYFVTVQESDFALYTRCTLELR